MKQPRAWSWPEFGISSGSFSQNSSTNAEDGFRKIIAPPKEKQFLYSPPMFTLFSFVSSDFDDLILIEWKTTPSEDDFWKFLVPPKKKSKIFYNAPPPICFFLFHCRNTSNIILDVCSTILWHNLTYKRQPLDKFWRENMFSLLSLTIALWWHPKKNSG